MHPSKLLRAAGAMFLAAFAAALPAQIAAYHDATTAVHQAQVAALTNSGFRPIAMTIYGDAANLRYGAVWVQRAGPAFLPFDGLTSAQYQSFVQSHLPAYVPTIVTACGAGANTRFAGVLELTGYAAYARHDQTQQQFDAEITLARTNGWRIASADVYGTGANPLYAVTFRPNAENVGWGYFHANGVQGQQSLSDAMAQHYARPLQVAFNDDSSVFLACWEDSIVGLVESHHDMTSAQYDQLANQYWNQNNRYPIALAASGSGANARFAASWATTDLPLQKQWHVTGQFVPELAAFDAWAQAFLQTNNVRGASLAIAKDGKLKLARGYTWAEPGYAQIQPTSTFRIASCSKPITSVAVHQQIQKNPAGLDYDQTMASFFNNPVMQDPLSNQIKVRHLLNHSGGWDRTSAGSNYDPMFIDAAIVQAGNNLTYPISPTDIRSFMQNQNLDFTPGSTSVYSNYGYMLLARILEVRNPGKTFRQIVQERVFTPLGLTRPAIGNPYLADRFAGEVLYHPRQLWVARSVNDNSRPWVAGTYGGYNMDNMDGNGAWVMAAVDYAKFLAAFDLAPFNPLLGPTQTAAMWTLDTNATFLHGWWTNNQNPSSTIYQHNGILPGANSYIGHRADGVSFVFFTNGDQSIGSVAGAQLSGIADAVSAWPQHDLFPTVGIPSFHRIDDLMAPYGSGCPGSNGTPRFLGSGSADIGQRPSFDLALALPGTAAFCAVGFLPTSYDLGIHGAPGCTVLVDPMFTDLVFTGPTGSASYLLSLPLEQSLVGAHLFAQDIVLDSAANQLGVHTTNGIDVTVGGWLGQ